MKMATAFVLGALAAAVCIPQVRAQEVPAPKPAPGRPDTSPEALMAGLMRSLERGEFGHALHSYQSWFHVTGEEDLDLLGQVARLSLIEDMHGRGWLRVSAARTLALRGNSAAIEVLRKIAADSAAPSSQRKQAIDTLGLVHDPQDIAMLQSIVYAEDRASSERLAAADSLLAMGDVSGVLYLVRCLQKPDGTERLRAATILGDRKISTDALQRAVREGDADLQFLALRALALQGDREAIRTLGEQFEKELDAEAKAAAAEAPETESEKAEAETEEVHRADRLLGVGMVLLQVGDRRPIDYFAALSGETDPRVDREMPARQVAEVDPELGTKLLQAVLQTGLTEDRINAAADLGKLGHTDGLVEVLAAAYREALQGDRYGLRLTALQTLGRLALPGAEGVLREALEDSHPRLQIEAARALANLGDYSGVGTLRRILAGGEPIDAMESAEALMEISDTPGQPPKTGSS